MSIRFHCPQCHKKLKAHDDQVGAMVQCSGCGNRFAVPGESGPGESGPGESGPGDRAGAARRLELPQKPPEAEEEPVTVGKALRVDEELDMTPMIDMTFLLLIFFMVTASFALQKSISIPPPETDEAAAQTRTIEDISENDFIEVVIDGDDQITIDEHPVPTRQELIAQLRERAQASADAPQSMIVRASGEARHEVVVMVMDAGSAAKLASIRLASMPDEE
jgi:biopolymer transport protein ExbD